jgi:hypothetical protein
VFCFFSLYCYNLDVHWLCDPRLVSIPEARGLFRPDVDVHQKPLNSITSFSHQTEQRICCSKKLQSLMPLQTNIKEALHIFFFSVLSERKWACMFLSTIFLFHIAIWGKNEKIKKFALSQISQSIPNSIWSQARTTATTKVLGDGLNATMG